jgi:DNA-binding MarR family transcriptional regulator
LATNLAKLPVRTRNQITNSDLKLLARKLYEDRRRRDRLFERHIFGEPAWDMLLALFGDETGETVGNVTTLCRAATLPHSTAVRWQWVLVEEGLIELGPPSLVLCERSVKLTTKGRKLMEQHLRQSHFSDQAADHNAQQGGN